MNKAHKRSEFMGYMLKPIRPLFLSTNGLQFIRSWEGFERTPKPDPVGNCTVGYGHKLADGLCDPTSPKHRAYASGISMRQAVELLETDVAEAERKLKTWLEGALVTQAMYDALVSLTFNTGGNRGEWMVYKLTKERKYQEAAQEFLNIDRARDENSRRMVRLPGLTRRRRAEHDTYLRASYSNP